MNAGLAVLLVAGFVLAGCTGGNSGTTTSDTQTSTTTAANVAPVASFVVTYTGLSITVNAASSTDSDGTITSYTWKWGDGTPTSTGKTATHVFAANGQYTVTLTITDDDGATSNSSQTFSVPIGTATATTTTTSTTTTTTTSSSTTSTSTTSTSTTPADVTPPDIPAYTLAVAGPNSLRANWTVWNDGLPVNSVIKYQTAADFGTAPLLQTGTQTTEGDKSFLITGLTSCTAYKARIEATDGAGNTQISDTLTASTNGSTPVLTPNTPMVTNVMHNSITIQYTVSGTSDITSKVEFGLTSSYGNIATATNGPGAKTVTLTGLSPDTSYNFIIKASSACGFTEGPGVNNIVKTAKLIHIDINTVTSGSAACYYPGTTYTAIPTCPGTGAPTCPTAGSPPAGSLCLASAGQPLVFEIKNNHANPHTWGISGVTPAYSSVSIASGATVVMPASITLSANNYVMTGTGVSAAANLHIY